MKAALTYLLLIFLSSGMITGCRGPGDSQDATRRKNDTADIPGLYNKGAVHEPIPSKGESHAMYLPERFPDKQAGSIIPEASPEKDYYLPEGTIPVRKEEVTNLIAGAYHEPGHNASLLDRSSWAMPVIQQLIVSQEKFFTVALDNDIFTNTDYYYTSGLSFELYHPGLSRLPTAYLLPAAGQGSVQHYSLSLLQTLFTPVDPDKKEIQVGDRPFASYLVLGHSNVSTSPVKMTRFSSRLDMGIIGPAALGGNVQRAVHEIEPVGWQNQIANDIVLNYHLQLEKGVSLTRHLELIGRTGVNAGTLYSNLRAGTSIRISNAASYFVSPFLQSPAGSKKSHLNYFIMISADGSAVLYDATLQGGLFTAQDNVYTITRDQVSRLVLHAGMAAGVSLGRFQLEVGNVFLTREFKPGRPHMWSRIKAGIRI